MLPLGRIEFVNRAAMPSRHTNTGVVHEDIDPSELALPSRKHTLHIRRLADIALQKHCLTASATDLAGRGLASAVKVVDYELWSDDWKAKVAASKFKDWPNYGLAKRGHIALQGDHAGTLAFRNVKIRELR